MSMRVQVIRTNGATELHEIHAKGSSARLKECYRLADCQTFDTVNLRDGRVMLVDDDGWETESVEVAPNHIAIKATRPKPGKAINPEATRIYHSICYPGTTHQIVGDVIIAQDRDFE